VNKLLGIAFALPLSALAAEPAATAAVRWLRLRP